MSEKQATSAGYKKDTTGKFNKKLIPSSSEIKTNIMPPKKKMDGSMMKSGGSMKKCKYGCK
jgi:hypothetical protein